MLFLYIWFTCSINKRRRYVLYFLAIINFSDFLLRETEEFPYAGQPYRVLYAFDPKRVAILLIGGKKTGDDRWYEKYVPIADKLYDHHLKAIKKEGLTND